MPKNKTKSYDEKLIIGDYEVDFLTVHSQLKENALKMRYQMSRMTIRRNREELIRKVENFKEKLKDSDSLDEAINDFCKVFFELKNSNNEEIYSKIVGKIREVIGRHVSANIFKNPDAFREMIIEDVGLDGLFEIAQIEELQEIASNDVSTKKRKPFSDLLNGAQAQRQASAIIFSPNKFTMRNLRKGPQTRNTNLEYQESFVDSLNQENYALANLGLVFEINGKKQFFSMPVKSKDFNFVNLSNFYNKPYGISINGKTYVRDSHIDEFLQRKHKNSSEKPNPATPNYEQIFYHSETALIYLLESAEFQKSFLHAFEKSLIENGVIPKASLDEADMQILAKMKAKYNKEFCQEFYEKAIAEEQKKLLPNVKILGKVVDLYSSREPCSRCKPMIESLLEPDSNLQKSLSDSLNSEGFIMADDEKLHVRVSTNSAMYEKGDKAQSKKRSREEISTKAPDIPLSPSVNFAEKPSNDYSLFISGTDRNRAHLAGLNL